MRSRKKREARAPPKCCPRQVRKLPGAELGPAKPREETPECRLASLIAQTGGWAGNIIG